MSFSPDIPSTNLGPQEYNSGLNVETDIRGIRSVLGDEEILLDIPNNETPIYVTGGYRANNVWWFIIGTSAGNWYRQSVGGIVNCAPGGIPLSGYSDDVNITEAWSGTTLFINDGLHPPMYLTDIGTNFVAYSNNPGGPGYIWNYDAAVSALTCGFLRLYNTPNVGSILIAGNLTATATGTGIITNFPTTVRWSQAFGLNDGPTTWAPTTVNVANEVEVPVRGPVIDGFPSGGNFFVCSYWDTVVFSPINYQGTNNPVLGIRLFNQGRGLLNANCWANADNAVYGVDARDIWVFDGNNFKGLGTQRVKNYLFQNLNPAYTDRVFVINNTQKSQIEIYYPDRDSATGWCNKMLAYKYNLDVFNAPRDISDGSQATESPVYELFPDSSLGFNPASRTVVYSRGTAGSKLVQKDRGHEFISDDSTLIPIDSEFRRDNIHLLPNYSEQLLVHRILPEVNSLDGRGLPIETPPGATITIQVGGADSVGQTPTFKPAVTIDVDTANPWTQINQNVYRLNSIKIKNISSDITWICPGITWQFTPTQDSR